jgi:hypothetical protein
MFSDRCSSYPRRTFLRKAWEASAFGAASLAARAAEPLGGGMMEGRPVRWQAHPVATIPQGYQVAVADVNADGRADILALSSVENLVEWYENPSCKVHPITSATRRNISLAPLFLPGYPAQGIALATDFSLEDSRSGGEVWWAEPAASPDSEWSLGLIGRIPTSHRLRWADLEGDGRRELVDAPLLGFGAEPPDYKVGAPLTWFAPPEVLLRGHLSAADPGERGWTPNLIDDSLTVVHGIDVLDWDGDGRDEILTASFEGVHLFHSAGRGDSLRWTKTQLGAGDQASKPRRGASEIGVGKLRGRPFLATIEPWHGEQVVVYFQGRRDELWRRQVIDDSFRDGHALLCADLDGDGNDEIVAGFRGPGTSLYAYYATDSSGANWRRQTLDNAMAASGVVAADLNADGRLDIVAIGASTGNVNWYENLG